MSRLDVNLELIRKYNVPGPRYTSFPPATKFTDGFTWAELEAEIARNNRVPREVSLYVHIPFCETLCWFCGCTTVITRQHRQGAMYLERLRREVSGMAGRLHPGRRVVQVHCGGGSPTFLAPAELRGLGGILRGHFTMAEDVEAAVEIDPRRLTADHVAALREAGFNRASVGVQDFHPQVQRAVHRVQSRALTAQAIAWIREAGFASLNIDLIYGLPYQTVRSFGDTLDQVLELRPDRLAVFNYAHVPWLKPSQKILETRARLPSPETKLELLKLVTEKLTGEGGYVYIGMDHFARPDDELAVAQRNGTLQRNFQGYSTRGGADIYGFGMSAISQTDRVYWQNHKELPAYEAAVDAGRAPLARGYAVTADDVLRRRMIMELMCNLGLDYAALSRQAGTNVAGYFASEIASLGDMEADGLLRRSPAGIEITNLGRLLIRNIAMRFDPYLPRESERRFSRTI
ncbi:MAG: oxygen-independent coproporphyrinogen III oxidase [Verrucomicrobia bacterium]|nr:oxygen-independent coproporphyrinogen III oxidase [Verrucomicrobiota bacterium]